MAAGALERAVGRATARRDGTIERCGMCAHPVPPVHRHMLDERDGGLLCACRPCALLFERTVSSESQAPGSNGARQGHYRLVPSGRLRLSGLDAEPLNVPVGLAFFVKQDDGRVIAHYPSPLGTTETEIDAEAWQAMEQQSDDLLRLQPRVEALLVRTNTRKERDDYLIVPVDDCYRLVATIRQSWSGMSGGSALWRAIAEFFEDLERHPGRRSAAGPHATGPR